MKTSANQLLLAITAISLTASPYTHAWIAPLSSRHLQNASPTRSLTQLQESAQPEGGISTSLPKDENIWKSEGERLILEAATSCGAKAEEVDIQWKSGKIIVTLSGNSFIQAKVDEEDDDAEIEYDEDIDEGALEEFDSEITASESEDGDDESDKDTGSDVVSVARAINFALGEEGEGSMAYNIAVHHEIEVTTPGASDELNGIMFEAYKGFDVIAETIDPKKDKVKIVEGKLVERNEKQTVLNVKGRLRKLKNNLVISVKLPKAKREKGVK